MVRKLILLLITGLLFAQEQPAENRLHIITRDDWGWKPLVDTIPHHTIKAITIHHGGVFFPEDKDPIAYLRNLQDWSRAERPWIDIPYHYMIDLQGKIYEARPIQFPGDTNTDYDPTGHALICVMGNYEEQLLSEHQLEILINLCAMLSDKYSVPVEKIKSHKDYTETACPGADIYQYLENGYLAEQIRNSIQQ